MNIDYVEFTSATGTTYYINPSVIPKLTKDGNLHECEAHQLLMFSDFVVNDQNELVKCRYQLTDMLRKAFVVKRAKIDPQVVAQSLENLRDELLRRATTNPDVAEVVMKINSCLYRGYPHVR